jgi:hypothetical protein
LKWTDVSELLPVSIIMPSSPIALMIEAEFTSELSVYFDETALNIPEGRH